jgi:hypothetical protein
LERALLYNLSGTRTIPAGPNGHFSQKNWGDFYRTNVDTGEDILELRAGQYVKLCKAMPDDKWTRVISEAKAHLAASAAKPASALKRVKPEAPISSDVEIIDEDTDGYESHDIDLNLGDGSGDSLTDSDSTGEDTDGIARSAGGDADEVIDDDQTIHSSDDALEVTAAIASNEL